MKRFLVSFVSAVILVALFQLAQAVNTTATLSTTETSTDRVTMNGTASFNGVSTTLTVSMPSGFEASDWNDTPITIVTSTGEATADSVRWTLAVQGLSYSSASTWHTCQTFTDTNTVTPFVNVFNPATYGKFPYYRLLYTGAGAKTAVQTLTISVIFDKDELNGN